MIKVSHIHRFLLLFSLLFILNACSKDDNTSIPEDVKLIYEDDFNGSTTQWPIGNFDGGQRVYSLKNGKFVLQINNYLSNFAFLPTKIFKGSEKKQIVEVSVKINAGSGAAYMPIGARTAANQAIDMVALYLNKSETFGITRTVNNKSEILVNWDKNNAVDLSKHALVRLELEQNILKFFVNNQQIYSLNNPGISTLESFGLGASQWEGMGSTRTEVEYDFIRIYASE